MACSYVGLPGSKYGPCETPCPHLDCAESRKTAASLCAYCKKKVGYGPVSPYTYMDGQIMHEECAWNYAELSEVPTNP